MMPATSAQQRISSFIEELERLQKSKEMLKLSSLTPGTNHQTEVNCCQLQLEDLIEKSRTIVKVLEEEISAHSKTELKLLCDIAKLQGALEVSINREKHKGTLGLLFNRLQESEATGKQLLKAKTEIVEALKQAHYLLSWMDGFAQKL